MNWCEAHGADRVFGFARIARLRTWTEPRMRRHGPNICARARPRAVGWTRINAAARDAQVGIGLEND